MPAQRSSRDHAPSPRSNVPPNSLPSSLTSGPGTQPRSRRGRCSRSVGGVAGARPPHEEGSTVEYTRLGSSGLTVSRIALGCMSFGDTSRGFNEWALDDAGAEPIFRQAVEAGVTFWDTANVYGYGSSEEIVGRAIAA